ncbi:hypothetical protein QZH41_018822 [Actinostola sp. cb2023]|nr:hypothetical protein QZH41_018822 [Actinostola sp. cb2023]
MLITQYYVLIGCKEGYSDKECQFACQVGCNEQAVIPTVEALYKKHKDAVGLWSISGYTKMQPIMVARQYCHGLMRKITYYVRISTALYSSSQNGQMVVIRVNSPPQFFASISEAKKVSEDEPKLKVNVHVEKRVHHAHRGYAWKAYDKSQAWLHCVSRRSGLPFWLLSAVLFMGFAFMLWLCCSSIGISLHEEKEKVLKFTLHIHLFVDDIFLLDGDELLNKKQPLIRSDEAESLPIKVNISATTI